MGWKVQRWSRAQGKMIHNGSFNEETKAARASDTLARALIEDGEVGHMLNFPDDDTEVWPEEKEKSSKYVGVSWNKRYSRWQVIRRSKAQGKQFCNGLFNFNEEIKAAHASDTLARELMRKGEVGLKLNFPENATTVWSNKNEKRKRAEDMKPHNN